MLHPGKDFPGGSKQVCLRFNYSKGRVGDSLKVVWNYEGRSIQEDVFRISEPKGFKAFCLLREDGSLTRVGGERSGSGNNGFQTPPKQRLSSPPWSWPTRSTGPVPRRSRPCWRSWRSPR